MLLIFAGAAAIGKFTAPPRTPSPTALAQSITSFARKRTDAADVRKISCEGLFYDPEDDPSHSPPTYACKWEQRAANGWHSYSSYLDFDNGRWRLKDHPDTDVPIDASSQEERRFRAWLIPHLREQYADMQDKLTIRYGYAFVDLNRDGRNEAIVTVLGGAGTCGTGGCEMFVEAEDKAGWREVSSTVRTREPIRVLSTKHHGWQDIGVVDGGGGLPWTIESPVIFNAREYDGSPSDEPVQKGVHGLTILTDKMVNRPLF